MLRCFYASYHTDHLGTPLALTDEQGHTLWEASPDDWAAVSEQQGNTDQPIRYQGQYEDEESGLYYITTGIATMIRNWADM